MQLRGYIRMHSLEFISCFVKKWYGHGRTSCYGSVLLNNIYNILCFQLDTFYFDEPTYIAAEDDGFVLVNLTFNTELRHDTLVQFRYDDLTAIGKLLTWIYICFKQQKYIRNRIRGITQPCLKIL